MSKSNSVQSELMTEFGKMIAAVVLFNESIANQIGMSSSEMQTIHLLQLHGPLTPGELATYTRLKSGSMTAVLDRLEQISFIKRQPHLTDRRKVVVQANEKHIAATLAPYYTDKAARTQETMNAFTPTELATITRFLKLLNK